MKKLFFVILFTAIAYFVQSFTAGPVESSTKVVKAEYGDTIWNIAEENYHPKEVRCFEEFVYDIRKENNLLGNNLLQAGQEVKVRITKRK